ncbi:unnamed protein product [Pleuronectes platessa]|uniref:Uncharacterized protein n=1 Tax=Pleuronectes platessa TaxID=8262 RepID=A0A9N7TV01_PLEPL|nr:unnamed protein product [Pleuronectes platessa]
MSQFKGEDFVIDVTGFYRPYCRRLATAIPSAVEQRRAFQSSSSPVWDVNVCALACTFTGTAEVTPAGNPEQSLRWGHWAKRHGGESSRSPEVVIQTCHVVGEAARM